MKVALLVFSSLIFSCGQSIGTPTAEQSDQSKPDVEHNSYAVESIADLPECESSTMGRLYYVEGINTFQVCKSTGWTEISIRGADGSDGKDGADGVNGADGVDGANGQDGADGQNGLNGIDGIDGEDGVDGISISSRWRFHIDSYSGQTNIYSEAGDIGYIGNIDLIKFNDGSALVLVSGVYSVADTNGDALFTNFSYSLFLSASTSEQGSIHKFGSFANERIRFKITLSSTPVFKAVVDTDGNFADNTDISFTLTQQ